ncbi:MAG: hypothetical protein Q8P18_13525 [Pseudomonadota bacterium]|nr:hypothetical protein [Pseudomonadota bacterium]
MTLLLALACAQPLHMQYDFARATRESAQIQADLSRESVAASLYPLSGAEAALLRKNVEKSSTDEESGEVESTQ